MSSHCSAGGTESLCKVWQLEKSGSHCQDVLLQREKPLRLWPSAKDPGGGLCVISRYALVLSV